MSPRARFIFQPTNHFPPVFREGELKWSDATHTPIPPWQGDVHRSGTSVCLGSADSFGIFNKLFRGGLFVYCLRSFDRHHSVLRSLLPGHPVSVNDIYCDVAVASRLSVFFFLWRNPFDKMSRTGAWRYTFPGWSRNFAFGKGTLITSLPHSEPSSGLSQSARCRAD